MLKEAILTYHSPQNREIFAWTNSMIGKWNLSLRKVWRAQKQEDCRAKLRSRIMTLF